HRGDGLCAGTDRPHRRPAGPPWAQGPDLRLPHRARGDRRVERRGLRCPRRPDASSFGLDGLSTAMAGEWMAGEMAEQPRVIGDLIDARAGMIEQIREVLPSEPAGVILVARGSSDNAAVWGRYVLEVA